MSPGWRLGSLTGEAWRNLRTGGASSVLVGLLALIIVGSAAGMEVAEAARSERLAASRVRSGGRVSVASSEEGTIEARVGVRLAAEQWVEEVGGVVDSDVTEVGSQPGGPIRAARVTPGLLRILDPARSGPAEPGLVLGSGLAEELGAVVGSVLATGGDPWEVSAVIAPERRDASWSRRLVLVGAGEPRLRACWVEVTRGAEEVAPALVHAALGRTVGLEVRPLRTPARGDADPGELFAGRRTRAGSLVAGVLLGLLVCGGFAARRSTWAIYRCSGSSRLETAAIVSLESVMLLCGVTVVASFAGVLAATGVIGPPTAAAARLGLRAGLVSGLVGTSVATVASLPFVPRDIATSLKDRP